MKWHFSPQPPDQVETEVTQRDQFDNDQVDISETIVREAIQNSLDAISDGSTCIEVTFRWLGVGDGLSPEFVKQILEGQLDHARIAELDIDSLDFDQPEALIIEDFGTTGLTGKVDAKDNDNFSDFWRRHGKSHKTGRSRGRWGLGKLVYSTSSQVGAFFGMTWRKGDTEPFLMGQTVLNLRSVGEYMYPPHAFFADLEHPEDQNKRFPVPVKDKNLVARFEEQFQLNRRGSPGLSVISLFPAAQFSRDRMIGVAIGNYFYPLITAQLKLQFDEVKVNHNNVRELARDYAGNEFQQIDLLFDFIDEVYMAEASQLPRLNKSWVDDKKLSEEDFDADLLEQLKDSFTKGELVGIALPVTVTLKSGERQDSYFSVYLKRPEDLVKGRDLYVRGGLTLPEEAKFRDYRRALGAMVAEDDPVCGLLGDAENAAHTKWTSTTEKLKKNYRNSQKLVMAIKNSLVDLYDLLVEEIEERDDEALQNFFWYEESKPGAKKPRPGPNPPVPNPPEPRLQLFRISQVAGGFTVQSTENLAEEKLPVVVNLQMAYDVVRGNPYKKYNSLDFKIGTNGNISVAGTKHVSRILSQKENQISIEVTGLPFKLECLGFDVNRDLKIRLTTETA